MIYDVERVLCESLVAYLKKGEEGDAFSHNMFCLVVVLKIEIQM